MQQTLLALSAVLAFSLYALGRHTSDNRVEQRAISVEVELAAAELAETRMAQLLDLAWDEEDVGTSRLRRNAPASAIGPDPAETPATFDDLDDFHGITESHAVQTGAGALGFTVRITARYVREQTVGGERALAEAASPTLAKEVCLRVDEAASRPLGRAPAVAKVCRVVTPPSL